MKIRRFFLKSLSVLPILFWIFALFYCEGILKASAIILAIALHECGHLFAFFLLDERRPRLRIHALGITLTPRRMLSYRDEATVAFFGPLFNLLTSLLLIPFHSSFAFAAALSPISLLLAGVHLLPIIPLDGGRISLALSHSLLGEAGARFAAALSFVTLGASLFFFLYFLLYYGIGLTPLFSVLLLFREQEAHRFDL